MTHKYIMTLNSTLPQAGATHRTRLVCHKYNQLGSSQELCEYICQLMS